MTADIRTAARADAKEIYIEGQTDDAYTVRQEVRAFVAGAVWAAARVTPTREQVLAVAEKVIGEFPEYVLDPNKSWAQQEAEELADAVLALMQGLAEGGS